MAGGVLACAGGARNGDATLTEGLPRSSVEAPLPHPAVERHDAAVTIDAPEPDPSEGSHAGSGSHAEHARTPESLRQTPQAGAPSAPARSSGHGHATPAAAAPVQETTRAPDGRLTIPAPVWPGTSATAREQIAQVERAVAHLDTPAKTRSAGFRPALCMIPTMGVHWVNAARMMAEVQRERPAHLMFSRVNGEDRLIGVAYAFIGSSAGEAPDLFDGSEDLWHEHPEFAPEGQTLVMLHVWFVPSPHGPFAGHNPWLAYWAAGMQPPSAAALNDAVAARRVHQLALALAEHVEPMQFAAYLQLDTDVRGDLARRRGAIGDVIPALNSAGEAGDQVAWNRAADAAIGQWKVVRDAYLAAVPQLRARQLLTNLYTQMELGRAH